MSAELFSARKNRPVNKPQRGPLRDRSIHLLYMLYKDITIYFLPLLNLYQWSLYSSYFSTQPHLVQPDPIWTRSSNIPSPSSTARALTTTGLISISSVLKCSYCIPGELTHISCFVVCSSYNRLIQIVARFSGDFA
jgi:hypothetical protein